jgi:hypothetical protein
MLLNNLKFCSIKKEFFIHKEYYCLVFELLTNNLYVSNYKGFNLKIIKKFTIQILFFLLCLI